MVQASDLKVFKTTNFLGGAITSTQVPSANPNNIFTNIPKNELVTGIDYYACVYFKNTNNSENMDNFKLWLSSKSFPHDTELRWGFDPADIVLRPIGYKYTPFETFNGTSDFVLEPHDAAFNLNAFTISAWFKTSKDYTADVIDGTIISKGGVGFDPPNQNFGMRVFKNTNLIRAGFEDSGGTDYEPSTWRFPVNDGKWHHCTCTHNTTADEVKVYIDGILETTTATGGAVPENNTEDLVIGRNSNDSSRWFQGDIDEVCVWNTALTADQVYSLYRNNTVPASGLVYQNKFGADSLPSVASSSHLSFDGVDDTINLGDEVTLWSQAKTNFSFSFLVYANSWAVGTGMDLLRHDGTSNGRFVVESISGGNNLEFNIKNTSGIILRAGTATVTTKRWHYVTCTYDNSLGSENLKLYVDSVKVGTADLTNTVTLTGDLSLGKGGSTNLAFDGYMKDFRYWVNDTLDQAEIDLLYARSGDHITPSYWLKMDEGAGNPVDSISGTKTGVITGAIWVEAIAQIIADKYTSPVDVEWFTVDSEPEEPNLNTLPFGTAFPVWLWLHVPANSAARLDDQAAFTFNFDIPLGGTGSPGGGDTGGGGGNPPPAVADYKVAVVGDEGCETETDDVIDLIQTEGYDHVVSVGDHAYASSSCWITRFTPLKTIMESAMGNHEYSESGGITPYMSFFSYSKTYLTYKFENIQFFIIDTNINCDVGSTQHNVIKAALEASQTDNTIVWRIAVLHHPMYGASSDHSYDEASTRANFHQLFVTNKVNFVLTGHNHNWQRTKQLAYNSSSPSSPIVVGAASPYSKTAPGFIHVISGAGGHDSGSSLYALGSQPSFQAYQNRSNNGVWEIIASNSGNTLTCSFVNTSGDKSDTFVINNV